MSKFRKAAVAVALLATAFVGVESTRLLPRGEVVELTAAQNMRFSGGVDDGAEREGKHGAEGRDVRLVYARTAKDKSIRTYRNEDVSAYLKFDSGSLNSKVQSILLDQQERQKPIPVLAIYYGWRVSMLSMYPNLISVAEVAPGYVYWPWQAALIVAFVLGGMFALAFFALRAWRAVRARVDGFSEGRAARAGLISTVSRSDERQMRKRDAALRKAAESTRPPTPNVSSER